MTLAGLESPEVAALGNHRSGLRMSLEEAFGAGFDIWDVNRGDKNSTPSAAPNLVACLLDDEQYGRLTKPGAEPEVVELHKRCLLVLPIVGRKGIESIATAIFETTDAGLLLRLAKQFLEKRALHNRVLELGTENDTFVRQVTDNFEELVFLRSLADYLEVTEVTDDVVKMAEGVLPLLNEFVHAECLMLVSGGGSLDECASDCGSWTVGHSTIRVGDTTLDDRLCARLVRRYQAASAMQPVVKNNCHLSNEFVSIPGLQSFVLVPLTKTDTIMGWLLAINRINPYQDSADSRQINLNDQEFGTNEATLLSSTASILATHATNVELFQDKEQLLLDMVRALVHAIEAKDPYTCGHSERVALYSSRLGKEVGLSEADCQRLYLTGLLHDVGKIGVDDSTLRKPGQLTDEEFNAIKQHPDQGWVILHDLDQLRYVLPGVLYHHERWDGKGYPDGLAGEDIPRDGRILAVADAYDAMTSDRPYRKGMPTAKAEAILHGGAGIQWDEKMVDAFLHIMPEIRKISESYQPRVQVSRQAPQDKRESNTVPFGSLQKALKENS